MPTIMVSGVWIMPTSDNPLEAKFAGLPFHALRRIWQGEGPRLLMRPGPKIAWVLSIAAGFALSAHLVGDRALSYPLCLLVGSLSPLPTPSEANPAISRPTLRWSPPRR